MRNLQKTLAFFGILITASIGQLVGCSNDAGNCELNYETCANASGSSGGIGPLPGCTDSPSQNAEVIRTDCAYFVGGTKANDSNAGGESDPFSTLGAAINAAKTKKARVYLCGSVAERVDIPAGVSVFGGFDCTADEWKYDATLRAIISPAAPAADAAFQSTLRISGSGKTSIEDVNIEAGAATIAGGSSIAVIVGEGTVDFVRANLKAGDGKNGAAGITPADDIGIDDPNHSTIVGNIGIAACMGGSTGNPGGDAKPNPLCSEAVGGKGGTGKDVMAAEAGDPGLPTMSASGIGGAGEDSSDCVPGSPGANGKAGNSGIGASDIGTIGDIGYSGATGAAGAKGTVGQGGGGGGGAKGKSNCNGASGGSGGSGGCAGNGGAGGNAGGASIGIVSLGGTITFSSVTITTGAGGNGGDGGGGQTGVTGGTGGIGGAGAKNPGSTAYACDGGKGGRGGNGGDGGGGLGGHSVGIAYKKGTTAPGVMGVDIQTGAAGSGGIGANAAGTGGDGVKDNIHELN